MAYLALDGCDLTVTTGRIAPAYGTTKLVAKGQTAEGIGILPYTYTYSPAAPFHATAYHGTEKEPRRPIVIQGHVSPAWLAAGTQHRHPDAVDWAVTLDLRGLQLGRNYAFCTDLDGGGPLAFGDTGLRVFMSPISDVSSTVVAGTASVDVAFECEVGCSLRSRAFLGIGGCDTRVTAPVTIRGNGLQWTTASKFWKATLDGSALLPGSSYVLCISLDPPLHGDPTPAEYGPVGTVFASPIESADPAVAVRDSAEFGVSCAVNALRGCLEAKVLLAMECGPDMASLDAEPLFSTAGLRVNRLPQDTAFRIRLRTSHLQPGKRYKLCVDVDGPGPIAFAFSGVEVLASPVASLSPLRIQPSDERVLFTLDCAACTSRTTISLSEQCGVTRVASASRVYGTLEPARAWLYQANQTTVSTSMVNPFAPTGTRNWYAEVTVGKLRPCEDVLLCIDIDGAGGTLDVDTGIRVATSCASVEDVAIYPGTGTLPITCGLCVTGATAWLAEDCATSGTTATAASTVEQKLESGVLHYDASSMRFGRQYDLCIDVDGKLGPRGARTAGPRLFLSPATHVATRSLSATSREVLLGCKIGTCSRETTGFLGPPGCAEARSRGKTLVPDSAETSGAFPATRQGIAAPRDAASVRNAGPVGGTFRGWRLPVDTPLRAGQVLAICIDADGAGPLAAGDTGLRVGVAAIQSLSPAVLTATTVAVTDVFRVLCPACSAASVAFVAPACAATPRVRGLVPLPSLYFSFEAARTPTTPTPGSQLRLCLDIDGPGPELAGDTGFDITVSPVSSASLSIPPSWTANVRMVCPTCTKAYKAYLARTPPGCDLNVRDAVIAARGAERTASHALTLSPDGSFWEFTTDAHLLPYGFIYALCLDPDGAGERRFIDAGAPVAISPVIDVQPRAVRSRDATRVVLTISCRRGICSASSQIYVAAACDHTLRTGSLAGVAGFASASAALQPAPKPSILPREMQRVQVSDVEDWTAVVGLGRLPPGRYRVCIDVDGSFPLHGMGDTGVELAILGLA